MNIDGVLYTLVYGNISSISTNPIEKKPFFHFYPGSQALTVGTYGCNFLCPWCQNWEISKLEPDPMEARCLSPQEFVKMAIGEGCQGSSISFNEPTLLFEYALDLFPHCREKGLYNTFVSNGYMTVRALEMLREVGLDAIRFDVKGDKELVNRYCGADSDVVWRNARRAKELGLHVEVVNLVVPGLNDSEESIHKIIDRHLSNLDSDTPLHFTRFHPNYKMSDLETTPIETLEKAYRMARSEGLNFVYLGNVPGHKFENTYCPRCEKLLIERYSFSITRIELKEENQCPSCGAKIPIIIHPRQIQKAP